MAEEKKESTDRKGILGAIDTPIRLAALIVLVVEGFLGLLLATARPQDTTLYVILMVIVLLVTIILFFVLETRRIGKGGLTVPEIGKVESQQKEFKYDVFLAAAMAGINSEDDFSKAMAKMEELLTILDKECSYTRVYFAGKGMKTKKDFDNAGLSVKEDIDAIKDSRIFILVYPQKIVSSVLYEAGIALAYGKPSFYFGNDFPFLMTQANNVFEHIRIYPASSIDDVIDDIKKNKQTLFTI